MASNGPETMDEASLDIGLENHYDLIVVGTDLTSSVVAAGTAFSNRSVLHLDANEHYGSLDDACFTFDQAVSWAQALETTPDESNDSSVGEIHIAAADSAILDKVALRFYRQRAAQTQQASEDPTPKSLDKSDAQSAEVKEASPSSIAAKDTPVDQEAFAALRRRLKLVRLNQTPNRRAKLLSFGASPLARVDTEDTKESSEEICDKKLDASNDSEVASSLLQPPVSEEQPSGAVAASSGSEFGPTQNEALSVPKREHRARLSVEDLQKQSRRWCLDLGLPRALLASGEVVDLLVASGVGRYLEFMAVSTLSVAAESTTKAPSTTKSGPLLKPFGATAAATQAAGESSSMLGLWNVPCSKQDIFSSSALSMLEKNRLMKLLRCALDWGTTHVAHKADLSSQHDLDLARGRALSRPQNGQASGGGGSSAAASDAGAAGGAAGAAPQAKKAPSSNPLDPEPFIAQGASFVEYLAAWKLPPRLLDAVLYGIALLPHAQEEKSAKAASGDSEGDNVTSSSPSSPSVEAAAAPVSTEEGLTAVFRHLTALGVHGETAFLAPLYGSGELAQAFCRLCAIHRGTYLLRHPLFGLVLEEEEVDDMDSAEGVLHSKDSADAAAGAAPTKDKNGCSGSTLSASVKVAGVCDEAGFVVSCNRFIAADDYLLPPASAAAAAATGSQKAWWTVRRVAIVDGVVGLRVAALRPNSPGVGNFWGAIQVTTADETTYSVPANLGASILHLTTTVATSSPSVPSDGAAHDDAAAALLAQAGDSLAKAARLLGQEWGNCKEVWHLSFALPLSKPPAPTPPLEEAQCAPANEYYFPRVGAGWPLPEAQGNNTTPSRSTVCNGLVLPRDQYHFDPHSAVATARLAFATLYPQDPPSAFLAPDEAAQQAQAEARGEVVGDLEEVELAAVLAADLKAEEERAKALADLAARVEVLEASNDGNGGEDQLHHQGPDVRLAAAETRMAQLLSQLA